MARILFVNPNFEDYLADGVFHGLRTLLGEDVIDFPKAEYLYSSASPATLRRVRGGGFTLYGLLPDVPIERDHVWTRALDGEFDLVVFGDLQSVFGLWATWGPQLKAAGVPMAVLDGGDPPGPYPFGGRWWRVPGWWFLPRAHNRAIYFKREITPATRWFASYLLLPPRLGRGLGLRPTSFCIPEDNIVETPPAKDREFAQHVVDPEVASRWGTDTKYAFTEESAYYDDLRRSRFGITTKRAGWDALRHYEIAANGSVPCFRDLDRKPPLCAPHGLDQTNAVSYRDVDDLMRKVEAIDDSRYAELQAGALAWARASTTVVRARQILRGCGIA